MDFLYKASYVTFVISFVSLFLLYVFYSPANYAISELDSLDISDFSFSGKVIDVSQSKNVVFFDLSSSCSVTGMYFADNSTTYSDIVGQYVFVSGHIDEYQGKRQYIFDEMKMID